MLEAKIAYSSIYIFIYYQIIDNSRTASMTTVSTVIYVSAYEALNVLYLNQLLNVLYIN